MKIAVIGMGYVGLVTAACLAEAHQEVVVGIDIDAAKITALSTGQVPFHEPGLTGLVNDLLFYGLLRFTQDYHALNEAEVIMLCVGTPSGVDGRPHLGYVEKAATAIGQVLDNNSSRLIVTKSTVPFGGNAYIEQLISQAMSARGITRSEQHFQVVSSPEFLSEGTALEDMRSPNRIVYGVEDLQLIPSLQALYEPYISERFYDEDRGPLPVYFMNRASAELVKYASNAFLAMKIAFVNEIARVAESLGADIEDIAPAIGADPRIGRRFLQAGFGWGGSCFGKDLQAMERAIEEYQLTTPLLAAVSLSNTTARQAILSKLRQVLKTWTGKRVALLGIAFKPGTDDVRDAPALWLTRELVRRGAFIRAYDPVVGDRVPDRNHYPETALNSTDLVQDADVLVICTEWSEFKTLNWAQLGSQLSTRTIIDARNLIDRRTRLELSSMNIRVLGVGR